MKPGLAVVMVSALILTTGCESSGEKETMGTILGAAAGGLLGAQFGSGTGQLVATGVGVFAGSQLGRSVGKSLDKVDRQKRAIAQQNALETARAGETTTWQNPESGNQGAITPTRTYQNSTGQYCREYNQTITIGGKTEEAFGTACRKPDGSWQIVS